LAQLLVCIFKSLPCLNFVDLIVHMLAVTSGSQKAWYSLCIQPSEIWKLITYLFIYYFEKQKYKIFFTIYRLYNRIYKRSRYTSLLDQHPMSQIAGPRPMRPNHTFPLNVEVTL
jgi:cell division protein FtsW (lipid II flippase)